MKLYLRFPVLFSLFLNPFGLSLLAQSPPHDHFADRIELHGSFVVVDGNNVNATKEPGEPNHVTSGGRSVWWTWTAPASGPTTIHTCGSNFDTTLAVYTGTAVNSLTPIASNDDDPSGQCGLQSRVQFNAQAGTAYQIAVDVFSGNGGSIVLTLEGPGGPGETVILPRDGLWKYLDDGSDQGTAWREPGFNDSPWAIGQAELGYGDGDETTVINGGPAGSRFITSYFRRAFVVTDPNLYTELRVHLLRDDGGVIYLNGTEVFRSNMPGGEVNYLTRASASTPNPSTYFASSPISPSLLVPGTNVIAVSIHQHGPGSSDVSFNCEITGMSTNAPPSVALTSPQNGANFPGPQNIQLQAAAGDSDGTVTRVEFFSGYTKIGERTTAPFNFTWNNPPLGSHYLSAIATDNSGALSISAPVTVNVGVLGPLIPLGSVWKYLDNGVDQGTAWKEPEFNDGAWASGPSRMGYGQSGLATILSFGPSSNNKYPTYYFRHSFVLDDPSAVTNLQVGLFRDDGGVVYLNGTEVFRSNMPTGPIGYTTYAAGVAGDNGNTMFTSSVNPFLLQPGTNVVAVSIHQANATSSDIVLNLQLIANDPAIPNSPPEVALIRPEETDLFFAPASIQLEATAFDPDGRIDKVEFFRSGILIAEVSESPFQFIWTGVSAGDYSLTARATDHAGATATSSSVNITVHPTIPTVNDQFADRILLTEFGTYEGSNMTASKEPGEPNHAGNPGGRSAWWSWVSNTNGPVTITTSGSSFDTLLAVYTGSAVNALTLAAQNDDDPFGGNTSRVTFNAVAGVTYHIAVDGNNGATGLILLNLGNLPPAVAGVSPAPGSIGTLAAITVTFSKPVVGVEAGDLLINGIPALEVSGGGAVYTFTFAPPAFGAVAVSWVSTHGIEDLAVPPNPFHAIAPGSTWQYFLIDTVAPRVSVLFPLEGATVRRLNQVQVTFDEPVSGVTPGDLLINGNPASAVTGSGAGPYTFRFSAASDGVAQLEWADGHGIQDLAATPNAFAGGSWSYTVDSGVVESVVINELMYNTLSASRGEEYIEILNTGSNAVNLAGWRFSRGVRFTFPAVTLEAGGFLVVSADVEAFQAKYPGVSNVIGNWEGRLSNGGENVTLENALGDRISNLRYADEGDWAVRIRGPLHNNHRGWKWEALHDGLGRSAELMNPALPHNSGQNWAPSLMNEGTPGRANSVATNNIAPLVTDVSHFPIIPTSTDSVTITARVRDESESGLTVRLFYRNASTTSPPDFTEVPMADDGLNNDAAPNDGIYGAILPPHPDRTVIEFYVQATDGSGLARTWPAAAREVDGSFVQAANALYQVDEGVYGGPQPIFRIIMTETERVEFQGINRQSNAEMNATFLTLDGTSTLLRYNVGVRIRGAGSRGAAVPNYRVNVPKDNRWKGVSELNLNAQFGHSQLAGSALSQLAGLASADARAIQVRVNGANLANAGLPQYSSYVLVEVVNGDFADNHFPLDGSGNVYSNRRPNTDLRYLGDNPQLYSNTGYNKTSNQRENDWSDLINLTWVLNNAPDSTYAQDVREIVDADNWVLYFAVNNLLGNGETSLGIGVGDDYNMYRGILDPRFLLIPHDWDTILAQGQGPAGVTTDIWRATALPVVNRFLRHPEFAPLYWRELKRLIDTAYSAEQINPVIDQLLSDYVPAGTIATMKNYAAQRNAYVLSQMPLNLTVEHSLPTSSGVLRSTNASFALRGFANVIETRSVTVNGAPAAWTAWNGRWTNNAVTLQPGINTVLVQAFGEDGRELQRSSLEVWYDTGSFSIVSGTLAASTTWHAANGPYLVTGNITVPAGITLTIAPGTTVYFPQGRGITVFGELAAEGTPAQRIRLTRQPGSSHAWDGIRFSNTLQDNRITHTDMEFAANDDPIRLQNANLLIENVTWSGTARTIIHLANSSLVVRHSIFPVTSTNTIHGSGIPAAGQVVLEGNYFTGTTGLSDSIHFSGGKRPGPILQVLNNFFAAGSDDAIELHAADAHIEGNVFANVRRDAPRSSTANAIAAEGGSEVTAARNLFFNNDHAILLQDGAFLEAHNNTIVGSAVAALNFDEPERGLPPGRGALLEGNILWDNETHFANRYLDHPSKGTVDLVVRHSNLELPGSDVWPGAGNLNLDPLFLDPAGDFRLLSGSPLLGAGPNGLDMGAFVPGGASISGEPRPITGGSNVSLRIAGPGMTHYKYRVNNDEYGAETPVSNPVVLNNLAPGSYTVYVLGKNSAGVWQPDNSPAVSRTWTVSPQASPIVLSEVLARNVSAVNLGGSYPDLIELYNESSAAVDLGGIHISDDLNNPYKFRFPNGTMIGPNQYLVLIAENSSGAPGIHLGFSLSANGESVSLYSATGVPLDSVVFGMQLPDHSISRMADGSWALSRPTFGAPNVREPLGEPHALRINEWLTDGSLYGSDFIELFNPSGLPVEMGGLYLTDNPLGWPARHRIAPLSFIGGFGHALFIADREVESGPNHVNFRLASEQGMIGLFDSALNAIDVISYGPQKTDISQGRSPSGSSVIGHFVQPTPGAGNPRSSGVEIIPITVNLMPMTQVWKYEESGTDLGTAWRASDYNDTAWPSGAALLYVEPADLAAPKNTPLNQTPGSLRRTTYFRTAFNVQSNLAGFEMVVNTILDDGAVIYLNGVEWTRIGMPGGTITYETFANRTVGTAGLETFVLPGNLLQAGNNVLAAEVHQASTGSSDIVWGMSLDAVRYITNAPQNSVLINEVMANNAGFEHPNDGTVTDWVELYNPQDTPADMTDMSLTDRLTDSRRWVFPDGTIIPPLSYLIVKFDSDSPASASNTGFGLKNSGDAVYLFDAPSLGGALLDGVVFGIQGRDLSIGRIPNSTGDWQLTLPTPGAGNIASSLGDVTQLKVNEWMAAPGAGQDDWFEIYNPNPQPAALGGLHLTDNLNNRTKYQIPPLSFIGSGLDGFQLFWAGGNTGSGADHVNFSLAAAGESLGLFTADAVQIDALTFGPQQSGVSQGRLPDGAANLVFFAETATPGESNYLPLTNVVVNEVLAHSDPPLEDAIELHNLTAAPVDLSGWFLSDSKSTLKKFRIPDGTILAANGFKVFYEYEFNLDPNDPLSFALSSAKGDSVWISQGDSEGNLTGYRNQVKFGPSENGVSLGRYQTSIGVDFVALSERTFGMDDPAGEQEFRTGTGLPNAYPLVAPIVISEFMYHPPDFPGGIDNTLDEYIKLHNRSAFDVPLYDPQHPANTWRLRKAVKFNFPPNLVIPAGGDLLVVSFDPVNDPAALAGFRQAYSLGSEAVLAGPWEGRLRNSTDTIELYKPDAPQPSNGANPGLVPYVLVEHLEYADRDPWPREADGDGPSLHRVDLAAYANDPVNWIAAPPNPGPQELDTDGDGMPDWWEIAHGLNPNDPGDAHLDADGDGMTNLEEYLAGTDPNDPGSNLALRVAVSTSVQLEFTAMPNRSYTIEYREALGAGSWTPLLHFNAASAEQIRQATDPVGSGTRFYRLRTPRTP